MNDIRRLRIVLLIIFILALFAYYYIRQCYYNGGTCANLVVSINHLLNIKYW